MNETAMQEPTGDPSARTRTVRWEDPLRGAATGRTLGGREYLEKIARGELPAAPIALVLGFGLAEVGDGRAVFTIEPGEHQYNPIGMVHGGVLATVLDSAMGCAVHSTLPAGVGYTTLELKVNYVRAVTRRTPRLFAEGRIVHAGRRIATAEGRVVDDAGKLYAHGTTTCLVLPAGDAPD